MILARTLRRTFLLHGPLPEDYVGFLQADPLLPAPTERTDVIEIEPRGDGLFSMRSSWGSRVEGSARSLARSLDTLMYRLAASDEGSTLSLNGSVLRLDGSRILIVAEIGVDLCELIVALLVKGAAFEGMGLVFVRAGGVVAHPVKPRLRRHRLAAAGLSPAHRELPTRLLHHDGVHCAIDPRMAGVDWSVMEGPVAILVFVDWNDGGRSAITGLRFETALARLMRCSRSAQRPDIQAFIRFRAMIEEARTFRLSVGDPAAAADLLREQMPLMCVDV